MLNTLGILATFIGTAISIWQAYVARKSASEAQGYYNRIVSIQSALDLDKLIKIAYDTRKVCSELRTVAGGAVGTDPDAKLGKLENLVHSLELQPKLLQEAKLSELVASLRNNIHVFRVGSPEISRYDVAHAMFDGASNVHRSLVALQQNKTLPAPSLDAR